MEMKIKNLSSDPGVYMMKDGSGVILYVGKARNLKARVSSYFQKDLPSRTQLLMRKTADIEVAITDNEVEALILECNLIKKNKPKFNVLLKDDKTYPYVRVDMQQPYPLLEYVRRIKKDGARYFGPYVSAFQLKDFLRWAEKVFRLRVCSNNEFRNRVRPCILYQMGQCAGPCVGYIDEKTYHERILQVIKVLEGKASEVIADLKTNMKNFSESQEFEKAAEVRDRIQQIEILVSNAQQKITDVESDSSRDIVHYSRNDCGQAVVVVMSVRQGRTVGVFQFPFEDLSKDLSDAEFLFEFLAQYYLPRYEQAPGVLPKEVLFPLELETQIQESLSVLNRALGKTIDFHAPKRGEARKFVMMVKKTAEQHLSELSLKIANTAEDLIDTQKKLHLGKFPHRIECFDISHFQAEGTVASRVVFIDGKPEKALYRHYHVREVTRVDDFKSLREVLSRRFENDHCLPDLLIVDGGKGQLAQAETIFRELGVIGVELASIAKARTDRDFQDAEITGSMERIFKPGQKNPIFLKPGTGAYRIVTQARDESHRFAIGFHRKVRDKARFG